MDRRASDQGHDLRELQRLVQLYPEQARLAVADESDRRTVNDVRKDAARRYPRVDWATVLEQAPQQELLKVIGVVTGQRDDWRDRSREQAEEAGDPASTCYVRTIRIIQASLLFSLTDGLDEEIPSTMDRRDLLGWDTDAADDLVDCAGPEADTPPGPQARDGGETVYSACSYTRRPP